jgi:hypothetical protein
MDSVERGQVLQALTKRLSEKSWQLGGKAGSLVTQHVWDASSEQIISDLAIQLQIDDAQCGQVGLDGDAGKGTQRAVESCARTGHTIQQDSAALHWLCGWVSAQSSVAARSAGN